MNYKKSQQTDDVSFILCYNDIFNRIKIMENIYESGNGIFNAY